MKDKTRKNMLGALKTDVSCWKARMHLVPIFTKNNNFF